MENHPTHHANDTDLIDYLCHTLCFVPSDSIALLPMQGGSLGPVLRVDDRSGDMGTIHLAEVLLRTVQSARPTSAVMICFGDPERVPEWTGVKHALEMGGLRISPLIWVHGNTYYNMRTRTGGEYMPGQTDLAHALGWDPLSTTEPLPKCAGPSWLGEEISYRVRQCVGVYGMTETSRICRKAWGAALDDKAVDEDTHVDIMVGLYLDKVRDKMLADLYEVSTTDVQAWSDALIGTFRHDLDWDRVETGVRLLKELIEKSPESHSPDLLYVYAHIRWLQGRGTLAGQALDRALKINPDHQRAQLLRAVVDSGTLPEIATDPQNAYRPQLRRNHGSRHPEL